MTYHKNITDLATELKLDQGLIEKYSMSYDMLSGFVGIKNMQMFKQAILYESFGKEYNYLEIPDPIKTILKWIIKDFKETSNFIHDLGKFHVKYQHLKKLIKFCLDNNIKPEDFNYDGIITYRSKKVSGGTDRTCEVVSYEDTNI